MRQRGLALGSEHSTVPDFTRCGAYAQKGGSTYPREELQDIKQEPGMGSTALHVLSMRDITHGLI